MPSKKKKPNPALWKNLGFGSQNFVSLLPGFFGNLEKITKKFRISETPPFLMGMFVTSIMSKEETLLRTWQFCFTYSKEAFLGIRKKSRKNLESVKLLHVFQKKLVVVFLCCPSRKKTVSLFLLFELVKCAQFILSKKHDGRKMSSQHDAQQQKRISFVFFLAPYFFEFL